MFAVERGCARRRRRSLARLGPQGASTLRFRRYDVEQSWIGFSDRPAYSDSQAIAHHITELYAEEEVDQVIVVYNHFESPLVQRVVEQEDPADPGERARVRDEAPALVGDFIYEPEPELILERLLPSSRPSCTGRCWSPPHPSRARG